MKHAGAKQPHLKLRAILLAAAGLSMLVFGVLRITVLKGAPVPFNPYGGEDVYAVLDVYFAEELVWIKRSSYFIDKEYFFYTATREGWCMFALDESTAARYADALSANAKRYRAGDEEIFSAPPVLRIQGYTMGLYRNVVAYLAEGWGISEEEIYQMFGSCFLTTNQSSSLGLGFITLGLFCLMFCPWPFVHYEHYFDRRTRKPTR